MIEKRITFVFWSIIVIACAVIVRLFYWQVIKADELHALAEKQHISKTSTPAKRGEILTSDGFPLVTTKERYLLHAYLPHLEQSSGKIIDELLPIIGKFLIVEKNPEEVKQSNPTLELRYDLQKKLENQEKSWVQLGTNLSLDAKQAIEAKQIAGISFELDYRREYPEASMAANLLGFVGKDTVGNQKGYFGLEGLYDLELQGRPGLISQEKDAAGKPILIGNYQEVEAINGRTLILNLDRSIQKIVEDNLKKGMEKYQTSKGEVIIMDPKTGNILAMASFPNYDPASFDNFSKDLYKNPCIAETYEPGSTFKVLTMSAALDAGVVEPLSVCDICSGPVKIGAYTIRTWNDEYHSGIDMRGVIQHSDNIGMVFVSQKLGKERLVKYLEKFGIGKKTGIDLEEEQTSTLRKSDDWKEIDVATAAFGQGVSVTAMQMVRSVAAIANDGLMPTPHVVDRVVGESEISVAREAPIRVIKKSAADEMTEMMVNAVDNGEAKWAKPKGYKIAGKTGTAQIPVSGHYDEEKTIASFIGFAPADDPQFIMLVKLREPQTSPWGSETAAPLWFTIAKELFLYYGIQPDSGE